MTPEREDRFYQELGRVPPTPASVLLVVEARVQRRRLEHMLYRVAAVLVLSFGVLLYQPVPSVDSSAAADASVLEEELAAISAYVNAEDIDDQLSEYVLLDQDFVNNNQGGSDETTNP